MLYFVSSHFNLRPTKCGNLPNLSYIQWKTEPIGTEFNNVVAGMAGDLNCLEVQKGKERIPKKCCHSLLGAYSSTVL